MCTSLLYDIYKLCALLNDSNSVSKKSFLDKKLYYSVRLYHMGYIISICNVLTKNNLANGFSAILICLNLVPLLTLHLCS